jgi:hypothetical protein
MYVVQIDIHHTCLAMRPTCGSFNCTTQLGQHLVADRTPALLRPEQGTRPSVHGTPAVHYVTHACIIHVLQVLSSMQWLLPWCTACWVATTALKCEAVAHFKPGFRHVTHHTLPRYTRGSVVSHVLTCCGLDQDNSRPVLQWQHRTHKRACN